MKLVKMSLAAAVLLGASAFAIDNVKVSGDAKLFYSTSDQGANVDLFDQAGSAADTALRLSVTGDLTKGVSFGATGYAVSSLGLENNLVNNVWTGAHSVTSAATGVDDAAWMGEMWVAATLGKTTAKLGRMELDTPLAFSESWSVAKNTFDAAVLINQDLPDTTLVGAWVGKGNGVNALAPLAAPKNNVAAVGIDGFMGAGANMVTFVDQGAYAAAVVNNSFKPATLQAWYYNVVNVADAIWLQADINCQLVKGLTIGAQYADIDTKGLANTYADSSAYALKVGYGVDALKVSAAFSATDKDGLLNIANVATNNTVGAQSKLYTETFWSYGYVGAADADSWNLTAEYDAKNLAKFGAYYTSVDNGAAANAGDLEELALTATKSFGPLDVTAAYINTELNGGNDFNTVQAYLTLNF
ncbi:porin [Sulfuricurvum sp.]|uniref:porin n=1 Tax=Sulfuricurvum sp. TaxID=2025608 RepID=UPI002E33FE95|nr:porin [Sulfuricurvum sp.]HEX5329974.1 porin [Sulfuricurvum sp.]